MTVELKTELNSIFSPAIAVPITVNMPEPITAPMPSDVRLSQPSDFLSLFSGFSESEMSRSMLFVRKSCESNRHLPVRLPAVPLPQNDEHARARGGLRKLYIARAFGATETQKECEAKGKVVAIVAEKRVGPWPQI